MQFHYHRDKSADPPGFSACLLHIFHAHVIVFLMNPFRTLLCISLLPLLSVQVSCDASAGEPRIAGAHSAAPNTAAVTVIYGFTDAPPDPSPLHSGREDWTVNGNPAATVHHAAWVSDALPKSDRHTYPVEITYRVYLELDAPMENGRTYEIDSPYGKISLDFHDRDTFCESIKVNQVGYHPESTRRYANLGVFLGSGGSRYYDEPIIYRVVSLSDDRDVYQGRAEYLGEDVRAAVSSGEHVYRLDLHEVPPGGPYILSAEGWGRSHPFEISYEAVSHIAYTYARGLYHQRCGIALESPWTEHTRDACHCRAAMTRIPWSPSGGMRTDERIPMTEVTGGHHDAGDFSRRPYHTIIPVMLMGYYEAFPDHFTDGQFNIPESGNSIPDLLDEALWAVRLWEHLQILDPRARSYGGVMAGTDSPSHPVYGQVSAASDPSLIGTWDVRPCVTASFAGMAAQAARLLTQFPEIEDTAEGLHQRALAAWEYLETHRDEEGMIHSEGETSEIMYASLQLYLAGRYFGREEEETERFYRTFSRLAQRILVEDGHWPHQYRPGNMYAACRTVHFISYLLSDQQQDVHLADSIRRLITSQAEAGGYMGFDMDSSFYPHGATRSYGWGAATAQGRYADVYAFAYRLAETEELAQRYFDTLCQFGDYALGLNPLGISFVTGLGSRQVQSPTHLDSYFTKFGRSDGIHDDHLDDPKGNVPGLLIFGPAEGRSGMEYQRSVSDRVHPQWDDLPLQRRWSDGWPLVDCNEFSIWETMIWNICLYGVINRPH